MARGPVVGGRGGKLHVSDEITDSSAEAVL